MSNKPSFKGCSVVSCGAMRPELKYLIDQGFLDADKVLYTGSGLHDKPIDLEDQLVRQVGKGSGRLQKVGHCRREHEPHHQETDDGKNRRSSEIRTHAIHEVDRFQPRRGAGNPQGKGGRVRPL